MAPRNLNHFHIFCRFVINSNLTQIFLSIDERRTITLLPLICSNQGCLDKIEAKQNISIVPQNYSQKFNFVVGGFCCSFQFSCFQLS